MNHVALIIWGVFVLLTILWALCFFGPHAYRYAVARFLRRLANAVSPDRF